MNLEGEQARLEQILTDLGLPEWRYTLAGSGVMVLHGIERSKEMGDVDIFCDTRLWFDIMSGSRSWHDQHGSVIDWRVFTTDPDDDKRRCDPPYLFANFYGLEVNIFYHWRRRLIGDIDVATWILNSEKVGEGRWPCVPLQMLLDWKEQIGRDKDQMDIEAIKRHLGKATI